jgi:hypothetical protein
VTVARSYSAGDDSLRYTCVSASSLETQLRSLDLNFVSQQQLLMLQSVLFLKMLSPDDKCCKIYLPSILVSIVLVFLVLYDLSSQNHREPKFSTSAGAHDELYPLIAVEPSLTETSLTPGASVVSTAYGPYIIAAQIMRPQQLYLDISKPCTNCYILAMHAILQDKTGSEIFTDSGAWLHHIIWFNEGRTDLVCPLMIGERFFGGGNERWTRRWNSLASWGYRVNEGDNWNIAVELMNDAEVEQKVQVVVRYEFIPDTAVTGITYKNVRPIWLDLTGCGDAEVEAKETSNPFSYRTPDWISPMDRVMVDVGGHMHDGGLNLTAYKNGKPICASVQLYDNQASKPHIVAAGMCKTSGPVSTGDVLWSEAHYDPSMHSLVFHGGKPDPLMGSIGVYIGEL